MISIVPLRPLPGQSLSIVLNGQSCSIGVFQKRSGLYMNLECATMVNGGLFGVLCENLNRIVRSLYLGFSGDFCFFDSEGTSDPFYSGLGTRFNLAYIPPGDLPPRQG